MDRVEELIIVSGFNVYPTEIEDVLGEVEGVTDAAVVDSPDAGSGRRWWRTSSRPGADAVALEEGRAQPLRPSGWRASGRPTHIEVVDELPLTVTGRVQRRLRDSNAVARSGFSNDVTSR